MGNIRNIWRPEAYHGFRKKGPFFEGWYYKMVDAGERHAYAVIPGVFIGEDPAESHCFVQTLDGPTGRSTYHRYPYDAFKAAPDRLEIEVGPNRFTRESISLAIQSPEREMRGALRFAGGHPWPVTTFSPGIMGWYALVPFMECYHGVLSFDHTIEGALTVDGETVDFTAGRGYIEKDWGQAFPRAWIWMQSNHFAVTGSCITASVAIIPWLGNAFNGFIVGLWHDEKLYRFATYTGARIERQEVTDDHVFLAFADRNYRIEIEATRAAGGLLHSPERTAMLQRVMESLTASIHVRLTDKRSGTVLFDDAGKHAGLEVVGELSPLVKAGK
jgi:hypothetical protein